MKITMLEAKPIDVLLIGRGFESANAVRQALLDYDGERHGRRLRVEPIEDLAAGLARLDRQLFDVVLLVPEARGLADIPAARAHAPETPIVVVLDPRDGERGSEALRLGADDYLRRDRLDGDRLARAVHYAIDLRQTRAELTRKKQELSASEMRFRNVIERNADGIIIVDRHGFVRYANPVARDMFGREFLVGRQLGYPLVGGETTEIDIVRGPGHVLSAEMRAVETIWEGSIGMLASLRDVTERRRDAETRELLLKEVDAQRQLFQTVVDHTPGGIAVFDGGDLRVKWANETYLEFLEEPYRSGGIAGLTIREFIPRAEESGLVDLFKRVAGTGRPHIDPEYQHLGFARGATYWRWSLLPIPDGQDGPPDLMLMALEITEQVIARKNAEAALAGRDDLLEEIRRLNAELERRVAERTAALEAANAELEAFSYSVSHDLRAPLRRIDGFSQLLLEDYGERLDAAGHDYLQRTRAACQRMGQLIDDMLALARLTRTDISAQQVDLSAMAQSILAALQSAQPARQVEIQITPDVIARGDAHLLRIALENLLDNAWKFTATHPCARIAFGVAELDGERVYFVQDDGAGFDMEYSDKLFGVFQRLHTTDEFEGTGVGLVTVKRIVQRHGGRVWATGAVEQGATFYFTLAL